MIERLGYAKGIYGEEEKVAVRRSLDSGWLSNGIETQSFEREFAEWWGVKYALTVNSGSSANLVALQSLDLPKGSEVITPAGGAFPTTIAPMIYLGLKPVFVDVKGLTIDPDEIEKAITKDTKAIVFAHTLGQMPDMDRIMDIARFYDLKVMEDCCFVGDTEIETRDGPKKIKDVKVGDYVFTRDGEKRVLKSWMTGKKKVITRFGITATPNHPFITKNGIKRFDKLTASDIIYLWKPKQSLIEESHIEDIQTLDRDKDVFITTGTQREYLFRCIDKYGSIPMERYQKVFASIIKTMIPPTMNPKTSASLVKEITQGYISLLPDDLKSQWKTSKKHEKKLLSGTQVRKDTNGTANTQKEWGLEKVYNLTVEGSHEFFANNVLVHNCDAVGSSQNGQKAGTFGDVATVSFYPAHHMTTGEGGMVLTNSPHVFREALSIRDWGRDCVCRVGGPNPACGDRWSDPEFDHRYKYSRVGLNFKMTEMSAAFGREQLKRLDGFIETRKENYKTLAYQLGGKYNPEISPFCYPLFSTERQREMQELEAAGIETRVLFAGNILRHPGYKDMDCRVVGSLPQSERLFKEAYFVGVAPHLTKENMLYIADQIRKAKGPSPIDGG